ncbi:transposase [Pseudoalteromonas piscicida]|uniref:Transposase n=1 Tax=Pseudoalteromonas piscicida TaxID=43662 RepID=A0AAQ2ERZ3_PSEO7|nr:MULTISPECIES: Tn7-like element transposition protein TnsE [Pseudoalteromonas]KJY88684.1 transposon Tn7 transposition transposition regulatory protein TnsE [Pseudoalteromonas piscicida]TMN35221.1 transposase [Pseudoalteromonas piscicida]TMN42242.1 transposase [Pseudoalteromonas piscicida]TMN48826.1 transposase [Pseudoalteromonas piscicida]TMN54145.1 transposase [Pseudoalteromonas piscicida]
MNQVNRFKTLPDDARIQAIGNLFKYNDRKTWDIGVRFKQSTRKALKFSQLPYLSRQVVLNQTVAALPLGFPIEFTLPDRAFWQTATVGDSGLVTYKLSEEQSQKCFVFESAGKTIYLPQLELARALFFTNNYLANAALINSALDLEFYVDQEPNNDDTEFPLDLVINALPTTLCPKVLFDNEGFRHQIAWLLLNSDIKNSFNSIYQYFSQERIRAPNVERWTFRFAPPQLEGVKVAARGWKSSDESTWFINRIELLDGLFFPDISDIGFSHPDFTENKPGSGKGKGGTYPQLPTQREIDENSDGSEDNESALIFCDATQRIYNRVPRTRKVDAKPRKNPGGKEDEDKPNTLPPAVSTDDPNSRGDTPRAAVDGLDDLTDNADLYLNKFDSFFKMLEILEQEHGVKQNKPIVRKLPEVGRSESHLMVDGSPRCMAIVRIEHQNEGYFLLEVDTSDGKASIATKVISARALAPKGKLRDFIPEIERRLLSNQFSWPKKYFDALVGEGNHKSVSHQPSKDKGKLTEEDVNRWAGRLFRDIN